ncbi:MAG: type II toxin-antitoxin system death-on-curing family toxin [Candidatus Micrarchaeota archaeon]
MQYVDADFAKRANAELVARFGGSRGAVNDANLLHVLERVKTVGGEKAGKRRIVEKATFLLFELIHRAHAFTDGNKRTGLAVTDAFLELNGYSLEASPEELTGFALAVASGQIKERQIKQWLETNVVKKGV